MCVSVCVCACVFVCVCVCGRVCKCDLITYNAEIFCKFCDRVGVQKDFFMTETSKQNFKISVNNYTQLLLLYHYDRIFVKTAGDLLLEVLSYYCRWNNTCGICTEFINDCQI